MESTESSVEGRQKVQSSLEKMRKLLVQHKLALFIGEEISSLPELFNSWWDFIGDRNSNASRIVEEQEKHFLDLLQPPGQSNIHNTLRTVGDWPIIFTTNMDRLVERLIWRGEDVERLRLDHIVDFNFEDWLTDCAARKLLIKIHGDSGIVTQIKYENRNLLNYSPKEIFEKLRDIFDGHSVLFLGLDMKKYSEFFDKVIFPSRMPHYMLQHNSKTTVDCIGSLNMLMADLELWEFTRYLASGKIDEIIVSGRIYERSYLATQREEYLMQQLALEEKAAEILFHTLQITNALATDEILEKQSRPKLVDIYRKDPLGIYSEDNVERAYQGMIARRNNLVRTINKGEVAVRAIFFYDEFLNEIEEKPGETDLQRTQRKMALLKYADAILMARSVLRPNSTLELLAVAGLSPEEMISMQTETFALIKLEEGRDEAICYAETAVPGRKLLQTHYIGINGPEVAAKRRVFELSFARAWSNKDSILKLTANIINVDKSLKALPPSMRERLTSLNSVVSMLDRSIDASCLVHLGHGSFGDVYKAKWNNIDVALKFLKEAVHSDDLYTFQQEYQSLLSAHHENIVKVYKMTVENNRLGLIMEYVDGHNLRQLLVDTGPQTKDVVLRCATQLSSAISHLHSMKIVHRDIKTDNILVTKDLQTFKLADFGLARVVERTEQYKTVKGTYRYMAPEILKRSKVGGAKYSLTVDVYSYGLVILETITGIPVFQNLTRDELEMGKRDGSLEPTIPTWCIEVHGPLLIEVVRRSVADVDIRPSMERIQSLIISNDLSDIVDDDECPEITSGLEVLCLGTGKGTTTLFTGEPSSSFVILRDRKPLLLVDLGFGVIQSYKKHVDKEVNLDRVYITHNHADHAAELPVILEFIRGSGKRKAPMLYAAPEVMHRLCTLRLAEVTSVNKLEQLAFRKTCEPGSCRTQISDDGKYQISVLPSQHSEPCYGFILYQDGVPVLGYTGDSGFSKALYDQLMIVPNVIIDARMTSTYEHAGFSDVIDYFKDKEAEWRQIFITGYGVEAEYPADGINGMVQLRAGERHGLLPGHNPISSNKTNAIRTNITAEYLLPADVQHL